MKRLFLMLIGISLSTVLMAQKSLPLCYSKENSGKSLSPGSSPKAEQITYNQRFLPDPFLFSDGIFDDSFNNWELHRNEVSQMVQDYEIGIRPNFNKVVSEFDAVSKKLKVKVLTDSGQLEFFSDVVIPEGKGPFPVVIGMNFPSGSIKPQLFEGCILIPFYHDQIIKSSHQAVRDTAAAFYKVFPELRDVSGNYSGWSWAISRLIDAIFQQEKRLHADISHIAVTGCSYAGKMAMFAGAFDERIALTIIQESGGGGINCWRVSDYYTDFTTQDVERVINTNYSWFSPKFKDDFNGNLSRLPYDHHQIISMIAPRAVLVLGNPDFEWLCDYSGYVSCAAAAKVWDRFGISDRFGFVFEGGHNHCMACDSENDAVKRFVAKYLFGKKSDTNIREAGIFKDVNTNRWTSHWQ